MRSSPSATIVLLLALALSACNAPALVTPNPAASELPPAVVASPTPQPPPTEPASPTAEPPTATPQPQALRIAYVLDGNVWGLERGSAPTQLSNSGRAIDLHLTEDGQRIAYLEYQPAANTYALRSVRFDGSDDRALIDQAGFDALYPLEMFLHYVPDQMGVVPGTHQLLFNTRGVLEGPGLAKNDDLIRVDLETGELATVLGRGNGGDFVLSPDASQLAIVRPDSIGFANIDGSQLRAEVLTYPHIITYSEYLYYPYPLWVGDAVLAAIPGQDPFFGPEEGALWRVPADGSAPVQLASLNGNLFFLQRREHAIVAPDGTRLAFTRQPEASGALQLWIHEINSGGEMLYAEGGLTWHGWAPDSVHFIYQDNTTNDVMLGQVGGNPLSLEGARLLDWIGPAEFLILQEMTNGGWRLMLRTIDGVQTELASFQGEFAAAAFAD